jgi:hypothetical protein
MWSNQSTVKRFIITVLVATMLHAIGCILAPPFEFGHGRAECFFLAFVSGIVAFPILFAAVLLPLRAGLRRFMPASTPHVHAFVAFIVLYAARAAIILARQLSGVPSLPFQHGYFAQWIFWSVFVVVITITFFWPFEPRATPTTFRPPQ